MRYAIVSDIHANLQAWNAVLKDIRNKGVDAVLCLGDVVGYGPDPAAVLESCYENVNYFILGNHDAVIGDRLDSDLFNDSAKYIIEWTKKELSKGAANFFKDMPLRMEGEGFVCAHGEMELPGRFGYIYKNEQALKSFEATPEQFLFIGHTHVPTKFTLDIRDGKVKNDLPENTPAEKYMRYLINTGSVGDPRDGKTTASYVIFDQEKREVKFRNVAFDVAEYRDRLNEVALPTKPFFISIFDGIEKEAETIKDMRQMEKEVVDSTKTKSFYVNHENLEETRTRRLEIDFSPEKLKELEELRQTHKQKVEVEKAREKRKNGLLTLLVILLLAGGGIFAWMKFFKKADKNTGTGEKQSIELIKDDSGKDDSGKDDSGKDDSGKDDSGKDDSGKDDSGKDDSVKPDKVYVPEKDPVLPVNDSGLLLAYEGFEYEAGKKAVGCSGGDGWFGGWRPITREPKINSESLDPGNNLKTSGNHILIGGSNRIGRMLNISPDGPFGSNGFLSPKGYIGKKNTSVYVSFLFQPNKTIRFYEFELHRDDLGDNGRVAAVGNAGFKNTFTLRADQQKLYDITAATADVSFFVLKIEFLPQGDKISVYYNPPVDKEPEKPTLVQENNKDVSFNGVSMGAFKNGVTLKVDEIRIGTSYESVTPKK